MSGLLAQLGADVGSVVSTETARMPQVQRNVVIIQYVEIAVIVIGALVAFSQKNRFWVSEMHSLFSCTRLSCSPSTSLLSGAVVFTSLRSSADVR